MSAVSECSGDASVDFSEEYFQPHVDEHSYLEKTVHFIQSIMKGVIYSIELFYHRYISPMPQLHQKEIEWKPDSKGLFVFVHGLMNDPAAGYSQISLLSSHTDIDVFAPVVSERGMCSLDQATSPLLPTLTHYVEKNPGKPICLLGTSNGGRIVTWLETELRGIAPSTPVKVSSVAGLHFGSSQVDLLDIFSLTQWVLPFELHQEINYGSEKAIELLDRIKAPLPESCAERSYEFYATTEDLAIPDLSSTLPKLNMGEQFHIIHGETHSSIVSAVSEPQITSCLEWIESVS